jgi:hypothetical protein
MLNPPLSPVMISVMMCVMMTVLEVSAADPKGACWEIGRVVQGVMMEFREFRVGQGQGLIEVFTSTSV